LRAFGKAPDVNVFTINVLERAFRDAGFTLLETGDFNGHTSSRFIVARRD
jgi:hypothetical protein